MTFGRLHQRKKLLEISQAGFSQSLDDPVDKVIYLHIAADDPSPPNRKIRYQLEQLPDCCIRLGQSSQLAKRRRSQ